jgi:hypothetical protein
VTLQIKSIDASGGSWKLVGLAISADAAPTIFPSTTPPRYEFHLGTSDGATWYYSLQTNNNISVWSSAAVPFASLTFPIRLDIVRNGANYDFKVNGSTVVTGTSYTSAQHDSMVYYHMTWAIGGALRSDTLTATVDNFGNPAAAEGRSGKEVKQITK